MRWLRAFSVLSALAVAGAACGVSSPERGPLQVPDRVTPDRINPTDPEAVFAGRGECLLAVGAGVKVLEVLPDTAAAQVLQAGDVVTGVNGSAVGSLESLLSITSGMQVGARVDVTGLRSGEPFTAGISLGPAPEDPSRPIVGFIPETKLEAISPAHLGPARADAGANRDSDAYSRPVSLGGRILRFNPLDSSWHQYPGIPTSRMAGLGAELYTLAASDHPRALLRMGDQEAMAFDQPPDIPGLAAGSGEMVFESVLGSVGRLLLISARTSEAPGGAGLTYLIVGADPGAGEIAWARPLPMSPQGYPWTAVVGYRSPSGDRVLVGMAEEDPALSARTAVLAYLVMDEMGRVLPRSGLEDLAAAGVVTGWYDDDSLLYVEPAATPRVATWTFDSGEHKLLLSVAEEEARDLRLVTPVGDGRHVLRIGDDGVAMIDGEQRSVVRPVTSGCSYSPIGGLAG